MADERIPDQRPGPRSAGQHWGGFLASGVLAFAVDAAVLEMGVRLVGLEPLVARLLAIAVAMVAGWFAHRRWTFAVRESASLGEFVRYAAAGWSSAAVNYVAFAVMLKSTPSLSRLAALVVASGLAMIYSYIIMRYAVFRSPPDRTR